jgi:signal transduction histidine kinase
VRLPEFAHLPEFVRTTTFRWTVIVASIFGVCIIVLFGFIYWQAAAYMTSRIDTSLTQEAILIARNPERRLKAIEDRLREDPRRIRLGGLFTSEGRRIAGNIESIPHDMTIDTGPEDATVVRLDNRGREQQLVRATGMTMPNGEILVIGRDVEGLEEIAEIVRRALILGLVPALLLCVSVGVLLSLRARERVNEVSKRVERIVAGDLHQRLPTRGVDEPFDKLAFIVNGMLDEIQTLIHELAGVGDDIAHDLRTPLTRVRVTLERGRDNAKNLEELQAVVDRAMGGVDQSLAIITALLRIVEIEHSKRFAGFSEVALADLVREVGDLYEPIAENKRITLQVDARDTSVVRGDRDLLLEALANLVDNAVKFTPEGGHVQVALVGAEGESVLRVTDTGGGIGEHEREAVTRRFYRSDKSRHSQGLGLGLSLVAAIVKLHGFRFSIASGPGCVAEITCPRPAYI